MVTHKPDAMLPTANSTVISAKSTTTQDSGLHKLPGELRNDIFSMALVEPSPIEVDILINDPTGRRKITSYPQLPALAQTCRAFYGEALSIYYSENTFHLSSGWQAGHRTDRWLNSVQTRMRICNEDSNPKDKSYIRRVVLPIEMRPPDSNYSPIRWEYWNGSILATLTLEGTLKLQPADDMVGKCVCGFRTMAKSVETGDPLAEFCTEARFVFVEYDSDYGKCEQCGEERVMLKEQWK